MKTKPDDQAYACAASNGHDPGMTKREWFAGMALQGMIASDRLEINDFDKMSIYAVSHANKLIEWLNKTGKDENNGTEHA